MYHGNTAGGTRKWDTTAFVGEPQTYNMGFAAVGGGGGGGGGGLTSKGVLGTGGDIDVN